MRSIALLCLALAWSASYAQKIDMPDVKGRIDHFGVDVDGQRLFVAALGNNTVEVIDLKAERHVRTLKGFAEPVADKECRRPGNDDDDKNHFQ